MVFCLLPLSGQSVIIPQIADGGDWHTTIVLSNTTANAATANLSFHLETSGGATQSWNLPLVETTPLTGLSLPGGSSIFLHTPGTATASSVGWGEVDAPAGVIAYVVFSSALPGHQTQDGTANGAASATRFLVPFDNTNGLLTAIAVANPTNATETISVNFRLANGTVIQGTLPNVPALGHSSFLLPTQFATTANQSGLAEFYTTSGSFAMIALRANPTLGFTSAPVFAETGPPIISGGTTGGGNTVVGSFIIFGTTNGPGFPSSPPAVSQITVAGEFSSFSPTEWSAVTTGQKFGSCTVFDYTYDTTGKIPSSADNLLDAGAIGISGPNLASGTTLTKLTGPIGPSGPTYFLDPTVGTPALGGTYLLTGSGGSQVGPFSAVSATVPSSFTVANWNAITAITRAGPLTLNWTGSGFDEVVITAGGQTTTGTTVHAVTISCAVPASPATFSVPTGALALLPATANGVLSVSVGSAIEGTGSQTATTLTPNLVGGGKVNYGSFAALLNATKTLPVQ